MRAGSTQAARGRPAALGALRDTCRAMKSYRPATVAEEGLSTTGRGTAQCAQQAGSASRFRGSARRAKKVSCRYQLVAAMAEAVGQ